MNALIVLLVATVILIILFSALVAYGLVRAARSARYHARRTKARIAEALPATAFGRRLWWLNCRVTRVEELARQATEVSSISPLAAEVADLAAQLESGGRTARARLKAAASLSGRLRQEEVDRIDTDVRELEVGADALIDLAETALEATPGRKRETTDVADNVRRKAESYKQALDELADVNTAPELEPPGGDTSAWIPPRSVVDADDLDAGSRLVAGVQRDEERGHRLDG